MERLGGDGISVLVVVWQGLEDKELQHAHLQPSAMHPPTHIAWHLINVSHVLLQLIPHLLIPFTQIRHSHNLNNQTSPTSEVLRALTLARLGVVLFPSKARLLPALVHGIDQVLAEFGVGLGCTSAVGAGCCCDVLERGGQYTCIMGRKRVGRLTSSWETAR